MLHCNCDGISDGIGLANRAETASVRDFSNKVGADSPVRSDDSRHLQGAIFGIANGIDTA